MIKSLKLWYENKNLLIVNNLQTNFSNVKIYINDLLNKENKWLFQLTKEISKIYDYKFVWSNAGVVYLKKKKTRKWTN